jgi:hypothetical protein
MPPDDGGGRAGRFIPGARRLAAVGGASVLLCAALAAFARWQPPPAPRDLLSVSIPTPVQTFSSVTGWSDAPAGRAVPFFSLPSLASAVGLPPARAERVRLSHSTSSTDSPRLSWPRPATAVSRQAESDTRETQPGRELGAVLRLAQRRLPTAHQQSAGDTADAGVMSELQTSLWRAKRENSNMQRALALEKQAFAHEEAHLAVAKAAKQSATVAAAQPSRMPFDESPVHSLSQAAPGDQSIGDSQVLNAQAKASNASASARAPPRAGGEARDRAAAAQGVGVQGVTTSESVCMSFHVCMYIPRVMY